jgi:hypothetical protein
MIGLLADVGPGYFSDLSGGGGGVGLVGPVGLSDSGGGDSVGLSGGVGLDFSASDGYSVGLNGGVGLFA